MTGLLALGSSPMEWSSAAIICTFAVTCAYAIVRKLTADHDTVLRDFYRPIASLSRGMDADPVRRVAHMSLSNPASELFRMFGSAQAKPERVPEPAHAPSPVRMPTPAPIPALPPADETSASERFFRALVEHSADGIFIASVDGTVRYMNASVERDYGFSAGDVIGHVLSDFVHPDDRRAIGRPWKALAAGAPSSTATVRCRVRDMSQAWRSVEVVCANMLHDPAVGGIVLTLRDITERTALEAQLTHRAFHDALTGLANRALFRDRVEHALARSRRDKTSGVAVLFLDLDEFKTVNDTMGHDCGDQLLIAVAGKLLNATRGSDTVARLGGDEFAILLENTRVDEEVLVVARRLLTSLGAPMLVGAREHWKPVRIGSSIGIARSQPDDTTDTLLRNADLAMYRAKKGGRSRYEIFHPHMHVEVAERIQLEADMRASLVAGTEFHLLYQPIVDLHTRMVIGVESLARWDHRQRGRLDPGSFVPLAEECGLVVPLGRWILREACRQASRWHAAGAPLFGVTINISARQLRDATFLRDVEEALNDFGIDPASITLDIAESVIMTDTDSTLGTLFELKELGVRLAIDDFGTGYSSLSYLRQFPIDVLKIDRSFVDGVAKDAQHSALARTVIALSETLGLQTIAEGIEHPSQHEALVKMGCAFGQGFLFAKPMPADQIVEIVEKGSSTVVPGPRSFVAV